MKLHHLNCCSKRLPQIATVQEFRVVFSVLSSVMRTETGNSTAKARRESRRRALPGHTSGSCNWTVKSLKSIKSFWTLLLYSQMGLKLSAASCMDKGVGGKWELSCQMSRYFGRTISASLTVAKSSGSSRHLCCISALAVWPLAYCERVHKWRFIPQCRCLGQQEVAVTTNGEKEEFQNDKTKLISIERKKIDC